MCSAVGLKIVDHQVALEFGFAGLLVCKALQLGLKHRHCYTIMLVLKSPNLPEHCSLQSLFSIMPLIFSLQSFFSFVSLMYLSTNRKQGLQRWEPGGYKRLTASSEREQLSRVRVFKVRDTFSDSLL